MRSRVLKFLSSPTILAAVLLPATLQAQSTAVQEKTLYNNAHTDVAARFSTGADTIYWMQPGLFRKGHGTITGYRTLLQDQDYRTTEAVQFGVVKYAAQGGMPDVSASGLVNNATFTLRFPQPATGNISAALWTLTLAQATTPPAEAGLRLVFPVPASQGDGVYIHTQRDTATKLTQSFRKQWTYYRTSQGTASAFYGAGTSMRHGAIYGEPVTQMFVNSSLYGSAEDLFGPEAMHPNVTQGDKVGWQFTGSQFASQVAVLLLDGQVRATPITTNLGPLFLQVPVGVVQLPFVLDATGRGRTTPIKPPAKLVLWSQAIFVDLQKGTARSSDATGIVAQ